MKFARKTDIIISVIAAVAALLAWIIYSNVLDNKGTYAEIYYQSELVETVNLSAGQNKFFSIEQEPDIIFHLTEDGGIAFEQSDCPDKICIKAGRLHLAGQYAACLPNRVYVRILSDDPSSDAADISIG